MTRDGSIKNATLDWDATAETPNAPRSVFFDDVYFSGDGPAETTHVFLNGNNLPARFEKASGFTIGELGFGTGLNFLVAWDAWRRIKKPDDATLHFFSIEAFPLATDDMARAHKAWPTLNALAARLRANLPPPHSGFHQRNLDDGVMLTLFYGDAGRGLGQAEGSVDAWFFDGFSPAKNPAMWTPEIFSETARLSSRDATFSTFTVAGDVRRALQAASFVIEKRPGFGRKREMLAGRLEKRQAASYRQPWFNTRAQTKLKSGAQVAVIGAGIAGASLAYALGRAGYRPIIIEANEPASGASGNPGGLIMPRLDIGDTPAGRFHVSAYLHTVDLLNALQDETIFNACGVLHHATSDKEKDRQAKLLNAAALPQGWIEAHKDGFFFPQAGIVEPGRFVDALLGDTPLRQETVRRLCKEDEGWRLHYESGQTDIFDAVVIANSIDALRFAQSRALPLTGSAGQIDWFPQIPAPEHAHVFGPYAAPAPKGGAVIGATYAPIAIGKEPRFTREATQSNIAAIGKTLPALAAHLSPEKSRPRAAIRCVTPDRLPIAGPVPDWGFYAGAYDGLRVGRRADYPLGESLPGLYILTGLGSRGLVTAPLAAAVIASDMTGAPAPVDYNVAEALHPARFFIRDMKRGA